MKRRIAAGLTALAMLGTALPVMGVTEPVSLVAWADEEVTYDYHYEKQGDYYAYYDKRSDDETWTFRGFCVSISEENKPVWDYVVGDGIGEELSPEEKEQITSVTILSEIDGQPVTALMPHSYSTTYSTKNGSIISYGPGNGLMGCKNLTTVTVPGSVTIVWDIFFQGCESLTEILVDGGESYTSVDGVLYTADQKKLVCFPGGKGGDYTVPEGTETIESQAFKECAALTGLTVPASVTESELDFHGCTALESITMENSLTELPQNMFEGCTALKSVTLPNDLTAVPYGCFRDCTALTTVTLPDTVTSIDNYAFKNCSSLVSITLPDALTSIGDYAFENCSALKELVIPEGITSIEDNGMLEGCTSLTSLTIPGSVESFDTSAVDECTSLTEILVNGGEYYTSVDGVLYTADKKTLVRVPTGLEGSFIIPDGTQVGGGSLACCAKLTSITMPKDSTAFGAGNFRGCDALAEIVVDGNENFTSVDGIIYTSDLKRLVRVPNAREGAVTIPDGTESIGSMAFSYCKNITAVNFPESLTNISPTAFFRCSGLQAITIPGTVESIGQQAFSYCDGLTKVTLENGVTSIGLQAFSYCKNLKSVVIPDSVTSFGNGVFGFCESLNSVEIPGSVETVSKQAFYGCSGLKSVKLGKGVKNIGDQCFYNCTSLTKISLPEGLETIGNESFKSTAEMSIVIPASVTAIGEYSIGFNNMQGGVGTAKRGYIIYGTPGTCSETYARRMSSYFTFMDAAYAPQEQEEENSLGDVNGDEIVNASDAAVVLIAAAKIGAGGDSELTDAQKTAANVNSDEAINASDAALILVYAAKIGAGENLTIEQFLASQQEQQPEDLNKQIAEAIVKLVNEERAKAGLKPVYMVPVLMDAAQTRAEELQTDFSHTRPDGRECDTILKDYSVPYVYDGENIMEIDTDDPEEIMALWMDSAPHKSNILRDKHEYLGFGIAQKDGMYYCVQIFTGGKTLEGAYLPA